MSNDMQQPLRIVAFGDSTTASRQGVVVYCDLLAAAFRQAGAATMIFNAGVGGHNTDHALERFQADVLDNRPDIAIIQFGINDAAWDVRNDPPPTGPRVAIDRYERNLRHFVDALKQQGAHVVLLTPNPMRWTPKMLEICGRPPYEVDNPDGFNKFVRQYAAIPRQVAAETGATLVDVFAAFEASPTQGGPAVEELLLDGQHPNSAGHRLVAQLLLDAVRPLAASHLSGKSLRLPERLNTAAPGEMSLQLPPKDGNPRNSEGAMVTLKDGRILLVYTSYYGGRGDHSAADLGACYSADGGRTWGPAEIFLRNEGDWNIMSVSLLRLQDGRIAMVYLVKNEGHDCRPRIRFSSDEARTWSPPVQIIPQRSYNCVNNDRLVQLRSGRLVIPASLHEGDWRGEPPKYFFRPGTVRFFLSDDAGATWRQGRGEYRIPLPESRSGLQEPGVVELSDGRLFAWARTDAGCQYGMHSSDGEESWSPPAPTDFIAPCSPMSMKRIPSTGHLLALWNDHSGRFPMTPEKGRQPLVAAVSRDDGRTWENHRQVESDLTRGFHYTAILFSDDNHVLLEYCAGPKKPGNQLGTLRVRRISVQWFYE